MVLAVQVLSDPIRGRLRRLSYRGEGDVRGVRLQGGGTPIPFNPPPILVARAPYRRVRNPMLMGVFASLFGLGFLLHSASMVLLWTPVFLVANLIEITRVEQPELERRFGDSYREYRRRVPMLIPSRQRADRRRGPGGLPW